MNTDSLRRYRVTVALPRATGDDVLRPPRPRPRRARGRGGRSGRPDDRLDLGAGTALVGDQVRMPR